MGLTAAFSRCFPRKPSLAAAPAPLALPEPPAAEPPKKERKISKTKFDLPQDPPSQNLRPWFKYTLALASLALLWRRIDLGLSSQTTDAVFVFIAIELLVLIRRKATASTTSDERRTSLPGTRGKGSSMSLANEMEARVIAQVRQKLRQAPTPEGLDEDDELLDVQLLRFVREHGMKADKVESCFRKRLAWKAKTFANPIYDERLRGQLPPEQWMSCAMMPNGEWACGYVIIGLNCGLSKLGNPVKIERIGRYDIKGMQRCKGGDEDLKMFYLAMVEHISHRLDFMTMEEGKLQQTYEIFDLAGLSFNLVSMSTLKFTQDVLVAFSTHYPSSFRKAVIINAPPFIGHVWGICSKVLPASVNAKVNILGPNYIDTLRTDLTEEALAWVEASNEALCHAPHPVPTPNAAAPKAA
jgi:hypothetical protein